MTLVDPTGQPIQSEPSQEEIQEAVKKAQDVIDNALEESVIDQVEEEIENTPNGAQQVDPVESFDVTSKARQEALNKVN